VASDIIDTWCKVRGLRPKLDYEFRVKAIIDGAPSDPSFPVPLYRRPGKRNTFPIIVMPWKHFFWYQNLLLFTVMYQLYNVYFRSNA